MIAPTLTGTAGDGVIDLSWTAVPERKWYRVRKDGKQVASKVQGTTYHADSPNGVETEWQIVAVPVSGPVTKSNLLKLTPQTPVAHRVVGYADLAGVTGGGSTVTHLIDAG